MQNITIRYIRSGDYHAAELLAQQVQTLHIKLRSDIYRPCEVVISKEEFQEHVKSQTALVAEVNGTITGYVSFLIRTIDTPFQTKRTVLYIDMIVVDEARNNCGIGTRLLDTIREKSASRQLDGIELQVNARNHNARRMYEHYGFTEKSINMELI